MGDTALQAREGLWGMDFNIVNGTLITEAKPLTANLTLERSRRQVVRRGGSL